MLKDEIDKICELLQLTQDRKKESLETYNAITKLYKSLRLPTGLASNEEPVPEEETSTYFPTKVYLAILKKTATGKNTFKKIDEFLQERETKYLERKGAQKLKFERDQTIYRFDFRK